MRPACARRMCRRRAASVLEVGIGSGLEPAVLHDAVTQLYGVDPSAELLAMARAKAAAAPFPVELFHGDADRLPLADASVDTVVVTWSLCSIANAPDALREMRRVLKPGGTLIFVEHGLSPDAGVRKWQNRLTPVWRRFAGGCHLNRKMDDLVRDAGFTIARSAHGVCAGAARVHVHVRRTGAETLKRKTKNEKRIASRSMANIRLATADDAVCGRGHLRAVLRGQRHLVRGDGAERRRDGAAHRDVRAQRPWIVLEDDGGVIGYAYASPHNERWAYRWCVNTAIYISRTHHRRGAGRALYTTLFELLRASWLLPGRRGHHAAESGQRRAARSDGIRAGWRVSSHRLQDGRLARCGLVSGGDTACAGRPCGAALDRLSSPTSAEWQDAVSAGLDLCLGRNEERKTKSE